ncbi:hypothetical protein EDB89DRAFT_927198 [Lactarius sanguifluus]|nr:hypothetical protein EDB89DRAFT_927198 [Lactarius sanguifluus]
MPPRPNSKHPARHQGTTGCRRLARRAYFYVARNQALSAQVRFALSCSSTLLGVTRGRPRPRTGAVTGRGRGVIGKFGLCLVCQNESTRMAPNEALGPNNVGYHPHHISLPRRFWMPESSPASAFNRNWYCPNQTPLCQWCPHTCCLEENT